MLGLISNDLFMKSSLSGVDLSSNSVLMSQIFVKQHVAVRSTTCQGWNFNITVGCQTVNKHLCPVFQDNFRGS